MVLFSQVWTLTKKNLRIAFLRHALSTTIVAFVLPVCIIAFLSYARNLFIPPSIYGIGTPTPVRTLTEGLNGATGGRDKVAFVNSGFAGGDIDRVIDTLVAQVDSAGRTSIRLENEAELLDTCRSTLRGATTCYGAVVFQSSPSEGGDIWNYTIRADGAFGSKIDAGRTDNEVQIYLLPLQRSVDVAISSLANNPLPVVEEYPFTSLTQEERRIDIRVRYQGAIINVIGIAFLVGMAPITYHLTGFIAAERELGMSQLIEAMMPNLRRWQPQMARILSYHLAFAILYVPGWIIIGVILGVGVFAETSLAIVIIFHVLTGLSFTSFSIFGASFFKKAQLSGITCCLVILILGIVAQVIGKSGTGTTAILSILFPSCNYVYFTIVMARFERQEMPLNMVKAAPENPSTLPGIAFWVFFIIQIFGYPLLGALVERSLYGTGSKGRTVMRGLDTVDGDVARNAETVQLQEFSKHYQPNWFRRQFSGITKTPKATVIAVNGLTLSARKGQICVLLGANGSGKSTTLDAIAGLNRVTSGHIKVDGTGGLGIAPQKNVLWDELTVEEHIRIFNRLKSNGKHDSKESLRTLIHAIDLDRKIDAHSKTLSGGQKRKLQLGMMFTGGSAVCCVDEVSSGLDPLSRRKIWDILLAERGNRTIILTTHFLDEADLLADQIAILSKGTLRAQGSSVELKDKLGGGYRIHLSSGPGSPPVPKMEGVVTKSSFGQTMYSASDSRQAVQIIKRLEADGLSDYQLSGPTIEDVFLQLADEVRAESDSASLGKRSQEEINEKSINPTTSALTRDITRDRHNDLDIKTGQTIGFFRQAWVLFRKRFTILRRNYLPYIAALLLPIIASGLVTLFVGDQEPATCSPDGNLDFGDIETFVSQVRYSLVLGPSSRFTNESLMSLFTALLPADAPSMIPFEGLSQMVHTVETLSEFNDYISQNYKTVRPAGIFLGDANSAPTFAYRANGYLYSGIFGQNLLNGALSNVSITTQFASFDIPWIANTGDSLQLTVYFGLAMAAYPAFFALYPTIERMRNIRGLEYSNGVRSLPLWLAYMAFDFIPVLISSAIGVAVFAAVSNVWYHVGYLFIIFALYGLASILLAYVVSLFAKTQLSAYALVATGQAVMFLVYMIAYLCTLTYTAVNKIDSTLLVVHFVIAAFSPMGSLVRSLFIALNLFSATCDGKELASNPGGILQYGGPILYLILQIFFLFGVLLWSDSGSIVAFYRRFGKTPPAQNEEGIISEEETAEELARVNSSNDGLRVLNLTKSFGKLTAVDNMTFGIKRGEVFALLGPNGAGKSTTISLIRGDIQPSKNGGNIFVENIEINRHRAEARSHLGVCPQYDAMDQMTVVEHLQFYARVRGVPDVNHNVREVIRAVGLESFKDRMAAKLSGGNKRKLSLGIALIGNPTVLLLDEPSSGMDAAAKRIMWKTLAAVVPGRSLLLTTHSMEEADALADRAGIMAKRMLAMGTSDGLRSKHGNAYYVHLVMKSAPHTTDEETANLKIWVLSNFPGADIEDKTYHGQIRFSVPVHPASSENLHKNISQAETSSDDESEKISGGREPVHQQGEMENGIGAMITLLEDRREELGLEHYSVSPTTLDQVFLTIVQKHNVEEEGYSKAKSGGGWWKKLLGRKG